MISRAQSPTLTAEPYRDVNQIDLSELEKSVRISFDLDDTLICPGDGTPREPRPSWHRRLFAPREPLRLGARSLMQSLDESGWEIWIYTTSYRSPSAVKRWLRSYSVRVARVVNQDAHDQLPKPATSDRPPSKNPRAFDIALHVDDSEGVRIEGERHGFRVVVIGPTDPDWASKVLGAAEKVAEELASPIGRHTKP